MTEKNIELNPTTKCSTLSFKKLTSYEVTEKKKVRNLRRFRTQYPDRESNSELSFRRALLYPFNYQGVWFSRAKVVIKGEMAKIAIQRLQNNLSHPTTFNKISFGGENVGKEENEILT